MRTIEQAMKQVTDFAKKNKNIRALVLQGSLVNPNIKPDMFSDVDPLFYVDDIDSFIENEDWISLFGTPISRFSDSSSSHGFQSFARLLLLKDGFKMDITFAPLELAKYANDMPLYSVVLDKDGIVAKPDVTDDRKFYVTKPSEKEFLRILHEFFFDTSYVVKSLKRDELFFTQYMFHILSTKVKDLCRWYAGVTHNWKVNVGSEGRYFKDVLDDMTWQLLKDTFPIPTKIGRFDALMAYFDLVHHTGVTIAQVLGYKYPIEEEQNMRAYCKKAYTYPLKRKNV